MDLRKDCELVEVRYENNGKKAVLTFLDQEKGEILEINFNKQVFENGNFKDDEEKAAKVDKWCEDYFAKDFDSLSQCVGEKRDVYVYDSFNALWETKETKKFDKDDVGKIFETSIKRVVDDGKGIHIYYDWKDDEYETKMMYADYVESMKSWFTNPQKQKKQFEKFEDKFGVTVENGDEIIGKNIMVEIKLAFKKFTYGDIKTPEWK